MSNNSKQAVDNLINCVQLLEKRIGWMYGC